VNYQNKCRLVKGWDELFAKCGENLNSLTAMKFSPYYKVFEEDASHWEDRLNRVHITFDVWIDVQRQWVYLEGIFAGNADIKQLLPVESSRFQNINAEFLSLMKKVSKSPYVMDVLNIPDLQKSLERLAELLTKIQKALGEYLERERASFPRFYFVGDEDLLELIGNSRDVVRVQKHFRKMFAGLHSLRLSEDASSIVGITSKEGEYITLRKPISFARNPKINDWLSLLELEMKQSLAFSTAEAVQEFTALFKAAFDHTQFLSFLYRFPAQVVVLATQIIWTQSVEEALSKDNSNENLLVAHDGIEHVLQALAETVLFDLEVIQRKKCEHLITEMVHQRDVIVDLIRQSVSSSEDFHWLYQMRFYFHPNADALDNLVVRMADASFLYGYEYLGVGERLVQTPLTDRCFLTLTQALSQRLGGSPFGPAGTGMQDENMKVNCLGKTESVKALGAQLGRFVLVFCCDDTFDFKAMARIFLGICQVGAWGCFDEFNRLEERILSAVSQQIQRIQLGLQSLSDTGKAMIDLTGRSFELHKDTGTMLLRGIIDTRYFHHHEPWICRSLKLT
jgi:dynein heavy chain 1